ncbi:MAG: DUF3445 domain-containing protein [Pseudomonadota bacterium]
MSPYIPFEKGHRGFEIALNTLDPADWIEPDDALAERLAQKALLSAKDPEGTFRAEAGTHAAQAEVLRLLTAYLTKYHPSLYWRDGPTMHLPKAGLCVDLTTGAPPLQIAGQLVDDDLCLMVRDETRGWHLGAASLHFPSHWSMAEKFGLSMDDIHAPVPGFADRMAARVDRIFDHLRPEQPVWRLNWSLHDEPTLPLPGPTEGPRFQDTEEEALLARAFMRVERQTLRKLPDSGAILFTIKTYIDPLPALLKKGGAGMVQDLHAALSAMDGDQLAYKGLTEARDRVLAAIETAEC